MVKQKLEGRSAMTAVFAVPPEVHLLDLSGPAQLFYEAVEYGAPITLKFVSVVAGKTNAGSSCGIGLNALQEFGKIKLKQNDVVFVPGLAAAYLTDATFYHSIAPFLKWIRNQHNNGATICSVCTGAFLLAEAGLLDGKTTTTHWKYTDVLKKRYPLVNILENRLFVKNERIYSSAGVASGIDLALFLLEEIYGTRFSAAIAREVVVYLRRGIADPQLSIFLQYRNHMEDRIHVVQEWLSGNLEKKYDIETLAERCSMSSRNLTRLFKHTTGITIGQYVEKLRVEHATKLLAERMKIAAIARSCGLGSTNQLRALLKKHRATLSALQLS